MKRQRKHLRPRGENPVALFPFLAVLICTMGVLILLLVILVRQARFKLLAEKQAASQPAVAQETSNGDRIPSAEELRMLDEDIAWQEAQIRAAREKTQAQLTEARLILGHIEDSLQRLRDRLQQLQTEFRAQAGLDGGAVTGGEPSLPDLERRLQDLRVTLEQLQKQLQDKTRQGRPECYAIIPYQGKFGTRRRPIYLECRADGVFLQPEGIRFSVQDFLGPLGPGNPLDAALRAVREQLLKRKAFDPQADGEPYPLLIVRPGGIEAFYAARAAMTSWGTEFGYELIEEDWQLAYPPPDEGLKQVVEEALALARRRQQFLVKAAPGKYGQAARQYRAAPYAGGAIPAGTPPDTEEDPMLARWQAQQGLAVAEGASRASPAGQSAAGGGPAYNSNSRPAARPATGEVVVSDGFPTQSTGLEGITSDEPRGSDAALNNMGASTANRGMHSDANAARSPRVNATLVGDGRVNGDSAGSDTADGNVAGDFRGALDPDAARSATSGTIEKQAWQPLANRHGANWGLGRSEGSTIAVTRPVRIECYPDRVVLVPEKGLSGVRIFYFHPSPEQAVEDLVQAVREYVETWGIAGRGMYWRPVLRVYLAPGAEIPFQMLQTLLQDSGLIVERANLARKT